MAQEMLMRRRTLIKEGRTFGIEYECTNVSAESLVENVFRGFRKEHDASIETPTKRIGNMDVIDPRGIVPEGNNSKIGVELVSQILDMEDENTEKMLRDFCCCLSHVGEVGGNERAGIHYHFSSALNLSVLKNLIGLAAHLEQVFFYLGGMGYPFRGEQNDSAFCRPITLWGPSAAFYKGDTIQTYNIEALLQAKTVERFFDAYGGIDPENPPGKYYPVRYAWITLFNLVQQKKTVEFRIFNQSVNPMYIWATLIFCSRFMDAAMGCEDLSKLPVNSIYTEHNVEGVLATLDAFCNKYGIEDRTKRILHFIVENTPPIKLRPAYVMTHLGPDKYALNYRWYVPKDLSTERIIHPKVVDIHGLLRR